MLDAGGAITWSRVSGVYGDTVTQLAGTTAANPQRFPGQQYDPYTALHYNYFRDYDPATGRYVEADPIGLKGGVNVYAYALGNPVKYTDPKGEFVPLLIFGGALLGAGSDLAIQAGFNWLEGNDILDPDCYDWTQVGLSGGLGALSGGVGGAGFRTAAGLSSKFSNVSRRVRRAEGLVGSGNDLHHWLLPRRFENLFGGRAARVVNGRWNLNPIDALRHSELHDLGWGQRTIAGSPSWSWQAVGAGGASVGAGLWGDSATGGCGCGD